MDSAALYAAIVESSDDAVIAKSLDGTVLSWNPAAERILGWSAAEMIGKSIRTIIPADRQAEEDSILARVHHGERVKSFETERLRKDGSLAALAIQVSPVRDASGTVVGASKVARDITAMVTERETRRASEERFRLMGDNLPVMAWIGDRNGVLRWGNGLFRDFFGLSEAQVDGFDWASQIVEADREDVAAVVKDSIAGQSGWDTVMPLYCAADRKVRWMLARSVPLLDEHGGLYMRFGTATDITQQREADERTRTLLKEVNHRTRNMLAMIQSMARRTAAAGGDFVPRLECRIAGLAATQDLLVGRDWSGVPIGDLVTAQLTVAGQQTSKFDLRGPDMVLAPGAAESIGMAISELATNAARHGALSVPEGRVELDWEITGTPANEDFAIAWRERGGPVVTEPTMTGFGSKIIEDVPRGKLCGAVEFAYAPAGFYWRLTCPARLALAGPDAE